MIINECCVRRGNLVVVIYQLQYQFFHREKVKKCEEKDLTNAETLKKDARTSW